MVIGKAPAALSVAGLAMLLLAGCAQVAHAKTAMEMLQEAPKPKFREGHTLLPLSRWGWTMPFDVRVELAEHWGYALEFGGYATPDYVKQLDDPASIPSKLCALTAADPKRYPLFVLTDRAPGQPWFDDALPEETWCHDAEGKLPEDKKVWSLEAPDEVFVKAGEYSAGPVRKIREKCPIAIVLNGGEYATNVWGWAGKYWEKDPKVLAAKGERDWFDYLSERKAHQELIVSDCVRGAAPDRLHYNFYITSGCPHRSRYDGWWRWTWDYKYLRRVSDLPGSSIYYMHFNSGWTGEDDMLTQALNGVGEQLRYGEPFSYNWLCAGWPQEKLGDKAFSDAEHYMGYLKCYYTAGMVGGVAGYFAFPRPNGFDGDQGAEPPSWLRQMMVLGHAHALFSHLEDFVRHSDLLPGPDRHKWSKDQPAYEFPTGDPEARVVARKHQQRAEWLVTAWAAGGADREVKATIPDLGQVTVQARACGSVYRATVKEGAPAMELVDKDGMLPTAGMP